MTQDNTPHWKKSRADSADNGEAADLTMHLWVDPDEIFPQQPFSMCVVRLFWENRLKTLAERVCVSVLLRVIRYIAFCSSRGVRRRREPAMGCPAGSRSRRTITAAAFLHDGCVDVPVPQRKPNMPPEEDGEGVGGVVRRTGGWWVRGGGGSRFV